MTDTTRERPTVTVYVRASSPAGEPMDVRERLERLRRRGAIEAFDVEVWPARVRLSAAAAPSAVLDAYRRFERWADRQDLSLRPVFEVREQCWVADDAVDEVLVTPVVCLAVHEGSSLTGVYPCVDGERTYTVADGLAALEADGGRLAPGIESGRVPERGARR